MKISTLRAIIGEIVEEELTKMEEESQSAKDAKSQGLTNMGWGRWGKDGKLTHKTVKGKLTPIDKKTEPKNTAPTVSTSKSSANDFIVRTKGPDRYMGIGTYDDVHSDEGEMEINGKYVSRKKVKAEKPEFYAQYNAARQAAGQDVYWDGEEFKPVYPEPDGSQDAQYAAEDEAENEKIAQLNSTIDKLSSQYTKTRDPKKMKQIKQQIDQLLDAVQKIKNRMAMQAKIRARGGRPF